MQAPRFQRSRLGGVVALDGFPAELVITRELLEAAHPAFLQREFRTFSLLCDNGRATYRLVRRVRFYHSFVCQRVALA